MSPKSRVGIYIYSLKRSKPYQKEKPKLKIYGGMLSLLIKRQNPIKMSVNIHEAWTFFVYVKSKIQLRLRTFCTLLQYIFFFFFYSSVLYVLFDCVMFISIYVFIISFFFLYYSSPLIYIYIYIDIYKYTNTHAHKQAHKINLCD